VISWGIVTIDILVRRNWAMDEETQMGTRRGMMRAISHVFLH